MVAALGPSGKAELERALAAALFPRVSARTRQLRDLGALARMLDEAAARERLALGPGRGSWRPTPGPLDVLGRRSRRAPLLDQGEYDRRRPDGSPSASRLSRRYGGWQTACRAAFGLQDDGTYLGYGQPWPAGWRGRGNKPRPYTREECLDGIRACARALGRRPTVETYRAWVADHATCARETGKPRPRLADYNTLHRHFGGWPAALAAAAITDADVAGALERWPMSAPPDQAPKPDRREPVSDDSAVEELRLVGARVRRLRVDRGIPEGDLLAALDISASRWRRMLSGREVCDASEVNELAGVLGARMAELLR